MNNLLSVIITSLNEDANLLNQTTSSIKETSFNNIDIIVVDDCSDIPVVLKDESIKIIRNKERIGCAQSRQVGATQSQNKYLLFTDSHMIYQKNWYANFLNYLPRLKDNTVLCGVCLGLDSEKTTLEKHAGKYNGARLCLHDEKENQILEGKWIANMPGDFYEISCLMGAIYIIQREYFLKLRGFAELTMWGSDEPCLSLKVWLSGGEIRIAKSIEAGHFFRDESPYSTPTAALVYNKIRMAKSLLPNDISNILIGRIEKDNAFKEAMKMINNNKEEIEEHRKYYQTIFIKDFAWFIDKFNIKL